MGNANETGEVPERLNGTVSKTVVGLVSTVGSNPTLSARFYPLIYTNQHEEIKRSLSGN
jgi:hypothetical protein